MDLGRGAWWGSTGVTEMGHIVGSPDGAESVHEVHEDKLTGGAWQSFFGPEPLPHNLFPRITLASVHIITSYLA